MSEIKILNDGNFLNGKPIPVYRIIIDQISIKLPEDKFRELTEKLGGKVEEDYAQMKKVDERYKTKVDRLKDLRNKILELLYGKDYQNDGWLIRKEFNDLDEESLDNLIEDYGKDLGIE